MDDSDDEIKPLKRTRKKSQSNMNQSPGNSENPGNSEKLKKKPSPKKSDSQTLFASANNKAISRFFSVKKNSPLPDYRYDSCPICSIDLNFIHGASPQAHINHCLDMEPEFEKGYCSGDSTCSLSNEKHFREYKHQRNLHISSSPESNTYDDEHNHPTSDRTAPTPCASDVTTDRSSSAPGGSKLITPLTPCASDVTTNCSFSAPGASEIRISSCSTTDDSRVASSKKKQMRIEAFFTNPSSAKDSSNVVGATNVGDNGNIGDGCGEKQSSRVCKTPLKSNKKVPSKESKAKKCPFYKRIPGSGVTVDAFRYGEIPGCTAYFLTHFHSDHYTGLKKTFKGKLYCSQVTANLVVSILRVEESCIVRLPMYERTNVDDEVDVTLLDANHCPGSVMFLFQLRNGSRILHVGDFRAHPSMFSQNFLLPQTVDVLYLDTTYCDAKYVFPSQTETIDFVVQTADQFLKQNPRTLLVCGTYTIGKERVFKALASSLNLKVAVSQQKMKTLSCLDDDHLMNMLTLDYNSAQLHVLPLGSFSQKKLADHLSKHAEKFARLLAFKPTGWTFSGKTSDLTDIKPCVYRNVITYGVPYSEHSSFSELEWFVKELKPKKIIPTVNIGSKASRENMEQHFQEWLM